MRRIGRVFAGTVMLASLVGCATAGRGTGVQARRDEPFRLAPGQTATIAGEQLTVGFTGVESDSRCPANVQCIRAGEARVRLAFRGFHTSADAILATEGAQPRSATFGAYAVHFIALEPQPRTDVPRPQYVATFRVTRR
jgi:hypothetical protein